MTDKKDATQPFLTLERITAKLWTDQWGLKHLAVRHISPQQRRNVSAADELETACLFEFAEMFGCLPFGNEKAKWNKCSEKKNRR